MLHSRVLAVVLVISLALPIAAMGAGTATGLVETTWVTQTQTAFVLKVAGSVTSKPTCSLYGRFAVALNTDFGRAVMQEVLAAQTSGRSLGVVGTGLCSTLTDTENVFFVYLSGPPTVPPTPTPTEFWATSAGTSSCADVCRAAAGFAVANSSGYVCKDANFSLQRQEYWQSLGGYYSCSGTRTAQCRCIPTSN
jgi:hypothetical protein